MTLALRPADDSPRLPRQSPPCQITAIEAARLRKGLPLRAFLERAGIDARTWQRLRSGATGRPRPATLRRLQQALDAAPVPAAAPGLDTIAAVWRLATCEIARQLGHDPAAVLAADMSVQRPADRAWLAAARCQQLGIYVTQVELAVSMSAVARATGRVKQAVSKGIAAVEDRRDDPELDALLDRVGALVRGE